MRGATASIAKKRDRKRFQSTHPLRGATDSRHCSCGYWPYYFNPRTPCGVRLAPPYELLRCFMVFQSTHPLRGATRSRKSFDLRNVNFNPRTPCGVRRTTDKQDAHRQQFQSTHPLRGATSWYRPCRHRSYYFNPRTPCGVRRLASPLLSLAGLFQSTHPLRGATAKMHKIFCAFCDNRQFYRVSPSGVPSVGALFTYSRGLQRAGAGANLPVNGCALGLRAKSSASPQAGRSACSRSVRFYSRTSCRGNKTAGCRVPDP